MVKYPLTTAFFLLFVLILSCNGSEAGPDAFDMQLDDALSNLDSHGEPDLPEQCVARLFGVPAQNTGLTSDQCGPSCGCSGADKVGTIPDDALINHVAGFSLLEDFPNLLIDPYEEEAPASASNGTLCAATMNGSGYTLETFPHADEANRAGAIITHFGACGLCSPLQDLAVYMRYPDLTTPVRECGLKAIQEGDEASLQCIRELGFTEPCAQVWFYNTRHTRQQCLGECIRLLNAPFHNEDGSLNECILCDEIKSGDVFKAVAGRTRRNTGLPSALCRPCEDVQILDHQY